MTSKELIKLLKKHDIGGYYLAHPDIIPVPPSFVPSEETKDKQQLFKRTQEAYYNHPLQNKGYRAQMADTKQAKEFMQMRQALLKAETGTREGIDEWLDSVGIGAFERVEAINNGDGDGPMSMVLRFMAHDIFLRINGRYDSYNGDTWDKEIEVVMPVEKTVVEFEIIK